LRNEIYTSIFEEFWNEKDEHFMQAKGLNEMDASMLLMPLMKCIGPKDPRWLSTLKKIEEVLVEDTMVHRYRDDIDNLPGKEHSFTTCSFWYIECLALAGRTTEARLLFDKMLSYSNHLGLYSEELGPSGDHLGNFPQALTHLALISAAFAVDRALTDTTP
jgi:pentatricopeptide repeat protein